MEYKTYRTEQLMRGEKRTSRLRGKLNQTMDWRDDLAIGCVLPRNPFGESEVKERV